MIEYIVDFGDKSSAFVRLSMAEVKAHGAELREPIIRCRDCAVYDGEGYGCSYGRGDDPNGFCAWGESAWVTCKCGEDIERHDHNQVCPSCGRRLMA